jgi:hypothetical protein
MKILKFDAYFESYLNSGRHLLYHNTWHLLSILREDLLKSGRNARGPRGVCFSRNINWVQDSYVEDRIVLDSDLMIRLGYRPIPIQELMYSKYKDEPRKDIKRNVWKGNLDWYRAGQRQAPHNIDSLPKGASMEIEFEERVLKDINEVGRFIVYIDIASKFRLENSILLDYLEKYPHIQVRIILDKKLPHKTELVDMSKVKATKKEPVFSK